LVVEGNEAGALEEADTLQDVVAERRVPAHLDPLLVVERPRLEEDRVAHADLADVVQRRAALDVVEVATVDAELAREPPRVSAHAPRVPLRLRVAQVERGDEAVEQVGGALLDERVEPLIDALELLGAPPQLVGDAHVLVLQARHLERAVDGGPHLLVLPRLRQQAIDAHLVDGVERRLEVRIAAHEQAARLGRAPARRREQLEAAHPGHAEIRHDDVKALALEQRERFDGRAGGHDLDVAPLLEEAREGTAEHRLIVDVKHARGRRRHVPSIGGRGRTLTRDRRIPRPPRAGLVGTPTYKRLSFGARRGKA